MITIIDYGLGNINAIVNAYKAVNIETRIATCAEDLNGVEHIILPGVGHFDHAMHLLNRSGMKDKLDNLVLNEKIPVLGICVGMQILGKFSEEGIEKGLAYVNAEVKKFDISKLNHDTKIPHMGWNNVSQVDGNPLFKNIDQHGSFYFLHSYHVNCIDKDNIISVTDYEGQFTSAFRKNNIYGVQFHPEKSHRNGELLLYNFAKL